MLLVKLEGPPAKGHPKKAGRKVTGEEIRRVKRKK